MLISKDTVQGLPEFYKRLPEELGAKLRKLQEGRIKPPAERLQLEAKVRFSELYLQVVARGRVSGLQSIGWSGASCRRGASSCPQSGCSWKPRCA